MKIALLTDGVFPFVVGGMQKHSYYLAKYLARAGVYVDMYFTYSHNAFVQQKVASLFSPAEQAFVRMIPVAHAKRYRFPGHYILESFLDSEKIWEALYQNLQQEQMPVDFIYAQGFAGWKTMKMKRELKTLPPIGVNFHGFEMWQMPASIRVRLEHWLLRPFVKANIKLSDVVLLLGEKLAPVVDTVLGKEKTKLESANGVTKEWLGEVGQPGARSLKFVFLGRYERRKGIEELHATIEQLAPHFAFNIDIVGPVPDHLRLSSDKVKYWGMVREEEEIRRILREADILVCPSYAEGMPTVILEAMASGLAVIATDVGAVGDLVSEDNGWIIPPGEIDALQNAMIEAMTSKKEMLAEKMSRSYSKVRQRYLWQRVADNTIREIESVI